MPIYRITNDGIHEAPVILGAHYDRSAAPINAPLSYVHDIYEHLIPGFGFTPEDEVRAFGAMIYCRRDSAAYLECYLPNRGADFASPESLGTELAELLIEDAATVGRAGDTGPILCHPNLRRTPRPVGVDYQDELLQSIATTYEKVTAGRDTPGVCLQLLRDGFRRTHAAYRGAHRFNIAPGMGEVFRVLEPVCLSGPYWSATVKVSRSRPGNPVVRIDDELN